MTVVIISSSQTGSRKAAAGFVAGSVRSAEKTSRRTAGTAPMPCRRRWWPIDLRLSWSIVTEDGNSYSGEASIDNLKAVRQTEVRGRGWVHCSLPLMADLPLGYHRCSVVVDEAAPGETEIVVTPKRAYWPAALDKGSGLVGVTAPLYGLRSAHNAGIGDFADLTGLAETLAPLGASFVGINPVHALFPSQPGRISPYAPSSRSFLNALMNRARSGSRACRFRPTLVPRRC